MPYAIITKDKPNSLELRNRLRPEHVDYLTQHKAKLLAAGAQVADDGSGGYGGVIIVDTEDRGHLGSWRRTTGSLAGPGTLRSRDGWRSSVIAAPRIAPDIVSARSVIVSS